VEYDGRLRSARRHTKELDSIIALPVNTTGLARWDLPSTHGFAMERKTEADLCTPDEVPMRLHVWLLRGQI